MFWGFNSPTEGIDRLQDFNVIDDTIEVLGSAFSLPLGNLDPSRFFIGTGATNSSHRLIYNNNTKGLFFDRDGSGTIAAGQMASLPSLLNLTHNNFVVI